MTNDKSKGGRPAKEPTVVLAVPVDKIKVVEQMLKRKIVVKQTPTIKIRVPESKANGIRNRLKKD